MSKFNILFGVVHGIGVDISVTVISESWLNEWNCALYNIPGFNSYHSCRCGDGGGLSIYVLSDIKHKIICTTNASFYSIYLERTLIAMKTL